ncbi:MAG: CehA/McbA family metallohydrolase [Candidatus Bipolaricaulaceae bacterium]
MIDGDCVQPLRAEFIGRFSSGDSKEPYRLLPFSVPPGTRRLEVRFTFERSGGSVLDLGLFDPRGHQFGRAEGFRGWSGSARHHVIITENAATPGYLPGPLYPGTWHVLLGLYKIAPQGCPYRVEVESSPHPGAPPAQPPPAPVEAPPPGPGWYKGDLQAHTHHSDADCSVAEVAAAAGRRNLDFLAITDHNTVSHHPYLAGCPRPALVPGLEVTTYRGHANVWGAGPWLDFRCRRPEEMAQVMDAAHAQGRLVSINHPKPGGPDWEFGWDLPFDALEVWHSV